MQWRSQGPLAWRLAVVALSSWLFFWLSHPVEARLRLCNQGSEVVSIALGYEEDGLPVTEGWWVLEDFSCEDLILGDLTLEFYEIYAIDAKGRTWGGDRSRCIDDYIFRIRGISDCMAHGFRRVAFATVGRDGFSSRIVNLTVEHRRPKVQTVQEGEEGL